MALIEEYKSIPEIERLTDNVASDTLFEVAFKVSQLEDYVSRSVSADQIALYACNGVEFASELSTEAKTIIGAINELNEKIENLREALS